MASLTVPFFRPDIRDEEINEVVDTLRSGWLTTGPKVRTFESAFASSVGAAHALALNSCTAALHVALEAMGGCSGQLVLVPTMTFAATAAVVRYLGAVPVLVDCDPVTLNMDLDDAERKIRDLRSGRLSAHVPGGWSLTGIVPVHVSGFMMDMDAVGRLAASYGLWTVEDAAHAFPAAWRRSAAHPWQRCGQDTAAVTCFSFYANKTITTGEGGMVVTGNAELAERMRMMALHGLSTNAWDRYSGKGSWDYRIIAPGFKYNMTDSAAAMGLHQLARGEEMRAARERIAMRYIEALSDLEAIELPPLDPNRIPAWHLFPLKLRLDRLSIDRDGFIREMTDAGVGTSVHWRPLHLHPYYADTFGWRERDCPSASAVFPRLVSLPIFSKMQEADVEFVIDAVRRICTIGARTAVLAGVSAGLSPASAEPGPAAASAFRPLDETVR